MASSTQISSVRGGAKDPEVRCTFSAPLRFLIHLTMFALIGWTLYRLSRKEDVNPNLIYGIYLILVFSLLYHGRALTEEEVVERSLPKYGEEI